MIVVITAHDEPTRDNLTVAEHLGAAALEAFFDFEAVRANVLAAINADPNMPLFALCHGGADHLLGNDDTALLTVADAPNLNARSSLAFACRTAEVLGRNVATAGGRWFGYVGSIPSLPCDDDTQEIFRSLLNFIAAHFPDCANRDQARGFIEELSARALQAFDDISDHATMSQLHALRSIWSRLRVHLPFEEAPVEHPKSALLPIV